MAGAIEGVDLTIEIALGDGAVESRKFDAGEAAPQYEVGATRVAGGSGAGGVAKDAGVRMELAQKVAQV